MNTRRTHPARERGIAMLLVIIALGAATVTTTGYLLSRRNSAAIGQNAADAITARWASRAAAEHALAVLQTEANWRAASFDGRLYDKVQFANAQTTVLITDLDGNSITGNENAIVLTALAQFNNITAATQWVVNTTQTPTIEQTINPTFEEFSIFTVSSFAALPGSTVGIWNMSPFANLRAQVNIGTASPSSSNFNVDSNASLVNSVAYLPPNAYSSLISTTRNNPQFVDAVTLQTRLASASASQSFASSLPSLTVPQSQTQGSGVNLLLAPGNYDDVKVRLGATIILDASLGQYYAFDDLTLENASTLEIVGNVFIEVRDDLKVKSHSTIVLMTPNSSATFLIDDDFKVEDAAVGLPLAIANQGGRDAQALATYYDPSKIRILSQIQSDPNNPQEYTFDDNSIVVASIHAPTAVASIETGADLIGRITANSLTLNSGTSVLYDPVFNSRMGLTNASGPLYESTGVYRPAFKTAIESYDTTVGYELLAAYVGSSVGNFNDIIRNTTTAPPDPANITPRHSFLAWQDTWPTELFSLESRVVAPINTIDGVFIQPQINIADLYTITTTMKISAVNLSGGGSGGGNNLNAMNFLAP